MAKEPNPGLPIPADNSASGEVEIVSPETLVRGSSKIRKLHGLEEAGFRLASSIGLLIALLLAIVGIDLLITSIRTTFFTSAVGGGDLATLLNSLFIARQTSIFDSVQKTLLPVFMAVLGYLFGVRAKGGS